MKQLLALPFLALPAGILPMTALPLAAQEAEAPSVMERGLRLFLDGLVEEMEPMLRDLGELAEETAPMLDQLRDDLGERFGDMSAYHAPEILPNGDILIRRREQPLEAPGTEPETQITPNADGSVDL
ncbi:hypothetical protein [Jannaschia sp. 2305UL9-9]|uniref:hypothetical protein n=1 Tax=Jannaschia sp. 2305UL9-9 TaxID=3121638 RepID=UPI0035296B79